MSYDPLSSYRKVYVDTGPASKVSVYTAAEIDRILLGYVPGVVTEIVSAGAMQENGTGKFLAATNNLVITDAFITTDTTIIINLDTLPEGFWSWETLSGSFTITSTVTESADVDFTWAAFKKGA